jgi:GAF domain-containing protein
MISAPRPRNETERLHALADLGAIEAPPKGLDAIVRRASETARTPMALVSLVDERRQVFPARVGIEVEHTPREFAFCAHAILGAQPFLVTDAAVDVRFMDNPLVIGPPHIRSYLGVPMLLHGRYAVGTLCVLDRVSRIWTGGEITAIETLAREALDVMVAAQADAYLARLPRAS